MPTPAFLLLLATFLPLIGFVVLFFLGRRMGDPIAGWVAIASGIAGFAIAMGATIAWYNTGQIAGLTWGPGDKPILLLNRFMAIQIDTLTVAMVNTITPIMALTSAFSLRYLHGDPKSHRYFTWYQLLAFAMLGFVLSANLLEILVFWGLIGVAAYSLARLGKPPIGSRAMMIFAINRIGDAALVVALVLLHRSAGNIALLRLDARALAPNVINVVGLCLFIAAAIRTCQYLFRAPIPAAALLQSVTSCASGVYLLARFFPILSGPVLLAIAITGLVALAFGAVLALRQSDITRVMACSSLSQFGLIYMAIGIGSWVGALFLLLCHAFFKALLILTTGGIVHAAGGEKRLDHLGGLRKKLPVCTVLLAIGTLAICAAPFTSGYYAAQSIFIQAGELALSRGSWNWMFFVVPAVISALTALYMTRCWMLTFWGPGREEVNQTKVRERTSFWFPLAALAVLSLIGGSRLMEIDRFVSQAADESENYRQAMRNPPPPANVMVADSRAETAARRWTTWPFGVGIGLGVLRYRKRAGQAWG